ncbi:MAG: ATP-binding cassette domain-containing protein, partial [Planctomycetota bacterium]
MAQLALRDITFGFGGPPLLDGVTVSVEEGERIALVGRNGAGKSTLLQVIGKVLEPESGEVRTPSGLKVGALWQEVPSDLKGSAYDVAASGLGERGEALARFLHLSEQADEAALAEMEKLQAKIDSFDGWGLHREIEQILTKLSLDGSAAVTSLSAGVKRRVLLARALASQPDLLLLDEPTNHLDVDSILWLEEFLGRFDGTVIFISHDRRFLRRVATRILDLDRGGLRSYDADYDRYLEQKTERLETEAKHLELLDKKLAEEEAWIKRGIKARRTRNEGRVRALEKLREERRAVREDPGSMAGRAQEADRSGRLVIETKDLGFAYDDRPIVRGLTTKIFRGDRIGILGPNGVGKTTLLRLLLGELEPQVGSVRHGTKLQIAYFDQVKEQLDPEKTVAENVGDGNDTITMGDQKRHIYGYLQDFLFPPEQARARVGSLSGGERNRVHMARLLRSGGNVLLLDEP